MATVNAISQFTGFDRAAITRRVTRFGLKGDINCKDIFELKPLDEKHVNKLSLEEARTELAVEDARLKRLQAEKIEGKVADVDLLMQAENELFESIAAIIKSSMLEKDKKDDIFTAIRDHGRKWEDGFNE